MYPCCLKGFMDLKVVEMFDAEKSESWRNGCGGGGGGGAAAAVGRADQLLNCCLNEVSAEENGILICLCF